MRVETGIRVLMDVKERCIGMCAIYFLANENSPFVYVMCVWADGCGGGGGL
ncbi:hypothetical protein HanXRQr2_Chr05g0196051 [Helianthus annuus]|uniref:Uncharacterized protein n=1 Tax=Helianthus annuus TaxID=4232 RepID=A0A9K3NKV1_HELAN|nr:hypothetical protein HanXRQr2_Chr05g0196051 [Helianthus annuus]